MLRIMKVAIAQLNYTVGDFRENRDKIISAITKAKNSGASLIVFAEHSVSGTPAYGLLNKVQFLYSCEEALEQIATAASGITALVGVPVQRNNRTVSAAALLSDGKIQKYITKYHVSSPDEYGFIHKGDGAKVIEVDNTRIMIAVGDDIADIDEYADGVDLVVNMVAQPYARGIIERRWEERGRTAYKLGVPVVTLNQVGGNTDVVFDGSSSVFDAHGYAIALLPSFEEAFHIVNLDVHNETLAIPYQNKTANVYRAIKLGLGDFFRKNGYEKACLGLSGGIDSAVVAAVAAEVLGADNLRVLLLPSLYSSDHSIEDARMMANTLGIEYDIVPITDSYNQMLSDLTGVFGDKTEFGVTEENIQSRLRMVYLMALSNKMGHLLLNTSNKSELAVGYGTLYGDNTGVLSIIGDLYKNEVFDLARYINRDSEIIPNAIIGKEPSAELHPNQLDTDGLPPYDEVDAILYRMIEEGQSREEIINAGFDAQTVQKIYAMILRNEQKRYQFCPVLRVSTCTFGIERVMPITSKYGF